MAALPFEVLLGVYLGLLTGIVPALVAGFLGFVFRYFTGVSLPGFGVVVLAVAIAGVNGGLLGLVDPTIINSPRLVVALVVVMMLSLYAHSQGDKLAVAFPRRFSFRALRKRTLSAEVVEFVGGIGKVTVRSIGPVEDLEGYPALPPEIRAEIAEDSWEFPADLSLSELEARLAERLQSEYDLVEATVEVDARGRARIAAAPPMGALSRRVQPDERAVSVDALLPQGMSRGESVTVALPEATVEGTLLSARSGGASTEPPAEPTEEPTDGGEAAPEPPKRAPTTDGGEGRATVTVSRRDAERLLAVERGRLLVESRGTRREFELLGLLRRAGKRVERVTVRAGGPLDGTTIGAASVRDSYGVAVLAVRDGGDGDRRGWAFSPRGTTELTAGDELFVVGTGDAIDRFREVA